MATTDFRFPAVASILDTLGQQWHEHVDEFGINFSAIRAQCFSPSEQLRVDAAHSLWNGGASVRLDELAFRLDDHNRATVLGAVAMMDSAQDGCPVDADVALQHASQAI